jgi:23S rRNA (cytosine1962-C5)-methyltransferase
MGGEMKCFESCFYHKKLFVECQGEKRKHAYILFVPEKKVVHVLEKAHERVRKGGLWIFKSEIKSNTASFLGGEIVSIQSSKGFVGKGYIHPSQNLAIRILTLKKEPIDPKFFRLKILEALSLREKLGFSSSAPRRLIHAEGDGLPGLVVDQYGKIVVVQFLTLGIEKWKTILLDLLQALIKPDAILEKSLGEFRKQEGLQEICKLHVGELQNPILMEIDSLNFYIDLFEGHKTGFYLDQRDNRLRLKEYVHAGIFLDPFAYTGGMSLYAASFGAVLVEAVEDSKKIFPLLEKNISANNFQNRIHPFCGNAFPFLRQRIEEKKRYDVVLLDPPSFAKSKKEIAGALRGYKELHISALKLLNPGGFLITYSCSQNISEKMLLDVVLEAAMDTGKTLQLLEKHGASRDHPIRAGMPETEYLKGFVFRVS